MKRFILLTATLLPTSCGYDPFSSSNASVETPSPAPTPETSATPTPSPTAAPCVPGSWRVETVDATGTVGGASVAHSVSLVIHGAEVHLAFNDTDDLAPRDLRYVRRSIGGDGWTVETIAPAAEFPVQPSLAIDGAGMAHVVYSSAASNELRYARRAPDGSWATEAVISLEAGDGWEHSFALDVSGGAHVSFYANMALNYAHRPVGGSWSFRVVDASNRAGEENSLALDPYGRPQIAYLDGTNFDLKYARETDTGWLVERPESVGAVGFSPAIRVDGSSGAHVLHATQTPELRYGYRPAGGGWSFEVVESGNVGTASSLAMTAAGLFAVYLDAHDGLKFARRTPGGTYWMTEIVDHAADPFQTSMSVDAAGGVHVAYTDQNLWHVKYAYRCPS